MTYTLTINDLDGDYQEVETLFLYASFQIFCDFMDNEVLPDSLIDWDDDVDTRGVYLEMLYLYKWWHGRQAYEDIVNLGYMPDDYMLFIQDKDKPFSEVEWNDEKYPFMREAMHASHVESERILNQETTNLERLMKIRRYLWT